MTVGKYLVGFILSLVLTIAAYGLVMSGGAGSRIIILLGVLAIVQMFVQLVFFLHLGDDAKPRMKLWSFVFMAVTLLIIVAGSIWIMHNMNYNMTHMTPEQKNDYMMEERDKGF